MKIAQAGVGAILSALLFAGTAPAQNVGIGFSNPASKLSVNGNLSVGADYNVAAQANGALFEGKVGIGTTTPNSGSQLHVYGPDQALQIIEAGGAANGDWADLRLQEDSSTNHHTVIEMANPTNSTGFQLWTDPRNNNSNDFAVWDLAAQEWRLWLNPSGYLGIGTMTPLAPLHVASPGGNNIVDSGTQVYFNYTTTALTGGPVTNQSQIASAIFESTVWCKTSYVS